jgi:hypothetical protein
MNGVIIRLILLKSLNIRRGITVNPLNHIESSIIRADDAKSKIRSLVFGNELADTHNVIW